MGRRLYYKFLSFFLNYELGGKGKVRLGAICWKGDFMAVVRAYELVDRTVDQNNKKRILHSLKWHPLMQISGLKILIDRMNLANGNQLLETHLIVPSSILNPVQIQLSSST